MKKMPQPTVDGTTEPAIESGTKLAAGSAVDLGANSASSANLTGVELPDAQSLGDAIKEWQQGDELDVDANSETDPSADLGADAKKETAAEKSKSGAPDSETPAARKSPRKVSRNQSRRFARQRALQALYQWDCSDVDASDVLNQFKTHQDLNNVDVEHFEQLFRGVAYSVDEVDVLLEPALDRPVTDLDPIERSVLRLAACELRDSLETPARVVINEAVELTKRFGADQGHKYVNGVIDKVALSLRATEMKAGRKS